MTITVFRARVFFLSILMVAFFATAIMVTGEGYSHHQEWFLLMFVFYAWALFELTRFFVLAVSRHPGDVSVNIFVGGWGLLFASASLLYLMLGYSFIGTISESLFIIFLIGMANFVVSLLDLVFNHPDRP